MAVFTAASAFAGGPNSDGETRWVVAPGGLRLRTAPSMAAATVAVLPFAAKVRSVEETGTAFIVEGRTGRWTRCRSAHGDGWAFGGFLTATALPLGRPPVGNGDVAAAAARRFPGLVPLADGSYVLLVDPGVTDWNTFPGIAVRRDAAGTVHLVDDLRGGELQVIEFHAAGDVWLFAVYDRGVVNAVVKRAPDARGLVMWDWLGEARSTAARPGNFPVRARSR